MNHWALKYIGKKWQNGGRGPDRFDCWGLLWWIYEEQFDIDLPKFMDISADDHRAVINTIGREVPLWTEVISPEDGDGVALGSSEVIHHIGIFVDLDGGVIMHANRHSGVVAQSSMSLKNSGYRSIRYFRHGSRLNLFKPV